jgi:hypothetical protein
METRITALYIHGDVSCRPEDTEPIPMLAMPSLELVAHRGVRQDRRFFRPENPSRKRQVSLIDEGTIGRHEAVLGPINRAFIKSQVILAGDVRLPDLVGASLLFESGAEIFLAIDRDPCYAMDLIAPGLREAMMDGEQGALGKVTQSGLISVGDRVTVVPAAWDVERAG